MFARPVAALALVAACSSTPVVAMFDSHSDDFYALPFPNDVHRSADGTLDLSLFPTNSPVVDTYRMAAQTLDGFSLNAAMFMRFTGEIDPKSLPDPAASIKDGASVFVIDIDPTSANAGKKTPIIATFRPDKTITMGDNRLSVRPYPGFTLDEGTTYALIVTTGVHDRDGNPIEADTEFQQFLAGKTTDVADAYAPLAAVLDSMPDLSHNHIVDAAVFTTQHAATQIGPALRKGVFGTPAPVGAMIVEAAPGQMFTLYTGTYTAPNFQTGTVPYRDSGGNIQIGSDGAAVVQRMEPMRFALTVPPGPTPAGGWPICIYAHGTGGDWQSFIQDMTAYRLAAVGIAVISTDQVLHGPRNPGGDPDVDFFNFTNPDAARDNALQGAADAWSQMRLALGLTITDMPNNRTVKFDPKRVLFFGHSQGGITGPAFVAFEPALSGAVLSGTGGLLYLSLLYKTDPVDFRSLFGTLVRDDPVDEDNPSLALAQMWIERSDGANFARYMVRDMQTDDTGAMLAPRNIFQTEGFTDTFAPNPAIEAFATAIGGNEVVTAAEKDIDGLTLRGQTAMPAPVTGNLNGATAVLAQYDQAPNDDGHYVVFDVPAAAMQAANFLGTLASTGKATVIPAQ